MHCSRENLRALVATGAAVLLLAPGSAIAQRALGTGNALDANPQVSSNRRNDRGNQAQFAGQRAMGSGNALDANPLVGSGGSNFGRMPRIEAELALRDAIVVGRAPNKSFRGDVGYTSTFDFRGELGSDDIFRFQRDSVYSGLATDNIRGIAGLQYQLGQSVFGQTTGAGFGDLIVDRPGAGVHAGQVGAGPVVKSGPRVNVSGQLEGTLRSTSDFWLNSANNPTVLDIVGYRDDGELLYSTASPLQGVRNLTSTNGAFGANDEPLRFAQADTTVDTGLGQSEPSRVGAVFGPSGVQEGQEEPAGNPENLAGANQSTNLAHQRLLESYRMQAERLNIRLDPARPGGPGAGDDEGEQEDEGSGRPEAPASSIEGILDALRKNMEQGIIPQPGEIPEPGAIELDGGGADEGEETRRAWELLRTSPAEVEHLLPADEDVDSVYELHMSKGEAALREGRWFDAEERFTYALDQHPGESMAALGRVVAQTGAGMFLSAGPNLRNLYEAYPEMLPVRLDRGMLPDVERTSRVIAQLRDRIDRDTFVAPQAALLLAFLGHQLERPDDVSYALDALDRINDEAGRTDPLAQTLRLLWLDN